MSHRRRYKDNRISAKKISNYDFHGTLWFYVMRDRILDRDLLVTRPAKLQLKIDSMLPHNIMDHQHLLFVIMMIIIRITPTIFSSKTQLNWTELCSVHTRACSSAWRLGELSLPYLYFYPPPKNCYFMTDKYVLSRLKDKFILGTYMSK